MHERLSFLGIFIQNVTFERQLSLWSLEEDKGRATLLGEAEDNNTKVYMEAAWWKAVYIKHDGVIFVTIYCCQYS